MKLIRAFENNKKILTLDLSWAHYDPKLKILVAAERVRYYTVTKTEKN